MSVSTLNDTLSHEVYGLHLKAVNKLRTKMDDAIVRYDAWFLIFVAVILALGATLLAGMAIWCVVKKGKTFTGRWSFKDFGLKVYFQCA
ncbi:hypothetical protein [uncultured Friedmanniella sp.]|uniref:hypothetical protein n=1 Tax=uncultured Friedmanniella sp. TaxID=335381 RepID=UPI0035C99D0E